MSAPTPEEIAKAEQTPQALGRQRMLKGMTPYTLSDVAFSRVEAKLEEHVRHPPRAFGWLWAVSLAAAAAVALVVFQPAGDAFKVVAVSGDDALKIGDTLPHNAKVVTQGSVALTTNDGDSLRLGHGTFQLGQGIAFNDGALGITAHKPWKVTVAGHSLEASDADMSVSPDGFLLTRGSIHVDGEGAVNAPATLSLSTMQPLELEKPRPPSPGELQDIDVKTSGTGKVEVREKPAPVVNTEADPEAIARAIKAQLPKLRVCHEKWLKVESDRARQGRDVADGLAQRQSDEGDVHRCRGRARRASTSAWRARRERWCSRSRMKRSSSSCR